MTLGHYEMRAAVYLSAAYLDLTQQWKGLGSPKLALKKPITRVTREPIRSRLPRKLMLPWIIGRLLTEKAEETDIVNFSPLCPTIQSGSLHFRSFKYFFMQLYFITK